MTEAAGLRSAIARGLNQRYQRGTRGRAVSQQGQGHSLLFLDGVFKTAAVVFSGIASRGRPVLPLPPCFLKCYSFVGLYP